TRRLGGSAVKPDSPLTYSDQRSSRVFVRPRPQPAVAMSASASHAANSSELWNSRRVIGSSSGLQVTFIGCQGFGESQPAEAEAHAVVIGSQTGAGQEQYPRVAGQHVTIRRGRGHIQADKGD